MPTRNSQGFSLLEVLIGLTLASLTVSLIVENLNRFVLAEAHIIETLRDQDDALSALLLLQHQLESASLAECTTDPAHIENQTGDSRFLHPYDIMSPTELILHTIQKPFYITLNSPSSTLSAPSNYKAEPGEWVVVDDCRHAEITSVQSKRGKMLTLARFNPADFERPFSVSQIDTRVYSFADGRLYLKRSDGHIQPRQEVILPHIQSLDINAQMLTVNGQYHAAF